MRILHTSDWHVGKTIRGRSRADEHTAVLGEIAGIAAADAVDLVLVTGDLFDTAAPTAESERIVYRALLDLAATGATVIVLGGNHDNDRRLQAVEPVLDLGRIITRAMVAKADEGGVVEVQSPAGETALVAVVPFLSQRYVVRADELMRGEAATHITAYAERVRLIVEQLCRGFRDDTINLIAAHLFVDGAAMGGGERPAHTVLDYAVAGTAFPGSAHYVALGHLHRAQQVPSPAKAWYAGSPLQLDFGETNDEKCVLVVDAAPGKPARVERRPLAAGRRLRTVKGSLAELAGLEAGDDYLRVVVREPARAGLGDDVRALFSEAVEVLVEAPEAAGGAEAGAAGRRSGRSPHDLFADYLAERSIDDARVTRLFAELLEESGAA
jgi:exonuclease SbcD